VRTGRPVRSTRAGCRCVLRRRVLRRTPRQSWQAARRLSVLTGQCRQGNRWRVACSPALAAPNLQASRLSPLVQDGLDRDRSTGRNKTREPSRHGSPTRRGGARRSCQPGRSGRRPYARSSWSCGSTPTRSSPPGGGASGDRRRAGRPGRGLRATPDQAGPVAAAGRLGRRSMGGRAFTGHRPAARGPRHSGWCAPPWPPRPWAAAGRRPYFLATVPLLTSRYTTVPVERRQRRGGRPSWSWRRLGGQRSTCGPGPRCVRWRWSGCSPPPGWCPQRSGPATPRRPCPPRATSPSAVGTLVGPATSQAWPLLHVIERAWPVRFSATKPIPLPPGNPAT